MEIIVVAPVVCEKLKDPENLRADPDPIGNGEMRNAGGV
jgi:hypothetical protein